MRYLLIVLAVVAALVVGVVGVGYLLPVGHRASRSALLPAPPDEAYAILAEVDAYPEWRRGVTAVRVVPSTVASLRYQEVSGDDTMLYEVTADEPPRRRVSRIADPDLPFGGQWTYELLPEGAGTRLTITEDGEVYNPVFRFVSRFVMGHTRTLDQFLEDAVARASSRRAARSTATR